MGKRKKIPVDVKVAVLTETGYKCGYPGCRNVLGLEFHHIVSIKDSGGNDASNLLPLWGLGSNGEISNDLPESPDLP